MANRPLRICYVAGREASYTRTRTVMMGLEAAGVEVRGCFPRGKSFRYYPGVILNFLRRKWGCDLVIVGFYGQLLLPIIRLLTWKPIIFDMYIATYDTMVNDREAAATDSWKARLFLHSDRLSCRLSNRIILETDDHIRDFAEKFDVDATKFRRIFLAADDSVVHPVKVPRDPEKFLVHFHGEYAPFHGVRYILKAADLLRDENVHFQIIGRGITYDRDMELARELKLNNVTFIDWVPYEKLAEYMSRAHVCLGIFGDNARTLRVVTNKVIETLAVGQPLISARNEPVQELVTDGESALLCERANPEALSQAILKLRDEPELREHIARAGHEVYLKNCTHTMLGQQFKQIAEELVQNGKA